MSNDTTGGDSALLIALAGGMGTKEAAAQTGLSIRTVQRRVSDPTFARELHRHRAELVSRSLGRLSFATLEAVETLKDLLNSETDSVRLNAAKAVLELTSKLRTSVELEERIARLERQDAITFQAR